MREKGPCARNTPSYFSRISPLPSLRSLRLSPAFSAMPPSPSPPLGFPALFSLHAFRTSRQPPPPSATACDLSRVFLRSSHAAQRPPLAFPPPRRFAPCFPPAPAGSFEHKKSRPPEGRRPRINAGGALLRVCSVYLEAASARAATAGRVLPSSTSRKAPPPVER